jgi:hypothetical protein
MSDQATRNVQALKRPKLRPQVTVPEPYEDVQSLRASVMALKELAETLAGQRGAITDVAVTWQDLLDLQLVNMADIPKDIGSNQIQR